MRTEEILNADNYYALAVSVFSKDLVGPEVAFRRLGMNILPDKAERERYTWNSRSEKFYEEVKAVKELGWDWAHIGPYFGYSRKALMSLFSKLKKKYEVENGEAV